jgi:predicted NACHT family NTPase
VLFEQEDLAKQIATFLNLANMREGEAVLKAIEAQHGLLVERADELWSFSHLTFQEYFTAQWLNQLQQDAGLAEKIADYRWKEIVKLATSSQQPADRLLRLIKQAIDFSISKDPKLQEFLIWVHTKTKSTEAQYNLAEIRAFYFSLACTRNLVLALNRTRVLARTRVLVDILAHNLFLVLDLACAHALARFFTVDCAYEIAPALAFNHDHDLALNIARDRALTIDPILANKLEKLRTQLLKNSAQKWNFFQQCWQSDTQTWQAELRQAIIEHRNIGHDWQFTESQEQALQRYHDANKFLVELLKQPGAVSESVRQEIEGNLLLPIATLRERQPEIYGE